MQEPIIQDEPQDQEPQGEPDYKVLYEEQKVGFETLEKENNDLKSITTGRMRQQERDSLLTETRSDINEIKELLGVTMKAQVTGDTQFAEQEYARIQQESVNRAQTSNWAAYHQDLAQELQEIATSKNLDLRAVIGENPALDTMRSVWTQATENYDRAGLVQAVRLLERISVSPPIPDPEPEAAPTRRTRSTERLPASSGGASLSDEDYIGWADEIREGTGSTAGRNLTVDEEMRLRAAVNAVTGRRTRR